jgi:hypothetical protein
MSVTGPELFSVLHGMGFGAAFLLTYTGGLEALWGLDPDGTPQTRRSARLRRLRLAICCMAALAWLTVLTGLYGLYPWYRAEPTVGADLTRFPRAYLLADPSLAAWSTFAGDWKAHIACLCPILTTAVAAVVLRYGPRLADQAQIRHALMALLSIAFATAGIAGGLGALLTKVAPLR